MDEFLHLTGDDSCDLMSLVELYKTREGDSEMLAHILEDEELHTPDESTTSALRPARGPEN